MSAREALSLRLDGIYTAPLAFLGKGHDIIGNRLAVATADELLLRLREFVERDFLKIEQARGKSKRASASYDAPTASE